MAPKVCVPMDFGRHLIGSPTHSNLKLNTSEGGEVRASSVILSFNSLVIDHMTTTLHMTSVDMLEFSEAAVQLFVDAAYSGTPEGMSRQVFRDINKIASVFEVTWLVGKCAEYFTEVAESVNKIPSYTELLYLFEEAAFVFENLKNKDFLKISINKIEMLNWKQEFIEKYLENADRLSTQKLDMVIELAGCEVECVVQTVSNQLLEVLKVQGSINIPVSCEYLLDNLNLSLCFTSNRVLFNQLFATLEGLPDEKMRWCFKLISKSNNISSLDDCFATASEVRSTTVVSRCNIIPNIYHDLDFNLSFEELLEWISVSEDVASLMMAIEAVWTWCLYRHRYQNIHYYFNTDILSTKLAAMAGIRGWSLLPPEFNTFTINFVGYVLNLGPLALSQEENNDHVIINCVDTCKQPLRLLSKEAKLKFHFKHPSVTSCTLPGECGFILKTVPSEAALWTLRLCTEKEDYNNESVHFHDEVQAENMHFYFCRVYNCVTYVYPISWLGWLHSKDAVDKRNEWERTFGYSNESRFKVLYKISH